ncbi:hypothetical protein [Corynebacterium pyruviciproducens]|uniref:hypothetical protein n=1 Tax=Corynebacterium pyruviciproducens TaxID=598660 RepID=UPI0023F267F5|nr:hypothetical protein [Corynebacterium pyruviciproducens]MDK7213220.1 hypothetical protein [Corynebacterium pyruviciproducens]
MSKIENRAGRALIAAATTLAIAAGAAPATNAAPSMTPSERQEYVDYLLQTYTAGAENTFWDKEVDEGLAACASTGGCTGYSEGIIRKYYRENLTESQLQAFNKEAYGFALAQYRAPLVATIVVPILALLGVGAWAVQQGLIPGL